MTAVRRRRAPKPTVRLDVSEWRELLDDGKVSIARGIVVLDGASHFEIVEGGADVLVEVELQPSLVRCTARLSGIGGGTGGRGFWAIPGEGAEVIVGVPDGELEAGPVILGAELDQVPDGLGATTYVICVPAGGQLLVHDGVAAEAASLMTKADGDAMVAFMKKHFDTSLGHTHSASGSGPPVAGTGVAGAGFSVPSPAGTDVLKGK